MIQYHMHTLYYLGIIFLLGSLVQWLSPKLSLPKVVGYLVLGVVIGPQLLNIIPESFVDESHFVIDMSLSLIAVMIGAKLKFSYLKEIGKQVLSITLFESTFAFISVSLGFYLLCDVLSFPDQYALIISILFGGLAAATAPAATMAVIHELKAKGKFTMTLLAVVALDDAMALILFAIAITVSNTIAGTGDFHFNTVFNTFMVIFGSALLGIVGAVLSSLIDRLFAHHKGMETISTLGLVFIVYSLSVTWTLEPLFCALVMGVVMTNYTDDFDLVQEEIDNHLEEIIFMLFFILSAMHLKLNMMSTAPYVIVAYVLLRFIGKMSGVYLGSLLSHADKDVQKNLGIALFPQAGLAIGLALSLQNEAAFVSIAPFILNVVIATTIIHETIGPLLTKYVLKKSQQLTP